MKPTVERTGQRVPSDLTYLIPGCTKAVAHGCPGVTVACLISQPLDGSTAAAETTAKAAAAETTNLVFTTANSLTHLLAAATRAGRCQDSPPKCNAEGAFVAFSMTCTLKGKSVLIGGPSRADSASTQP